MLLFSTHQIKHDCVFGDQKDRPIEDDLLSTHNIILAIFSLNTRLHQVEGIGL